MLNEDHRFTPPEAVVADVLAFHKGVTGFDYEMRRLDFFLFMLVHQFRMPPLQILFIGLSILVATTFTDAGMPVAVVIGTLAYLAQWAVQTAFLFLVAVVFGNQRLYTRHEVKPLEDSLEVCTPYARQYYYWQGLERVLNTPWFIAVYVNKHAAHVIPNRAFPSAEVRKDFVKLIETMRNA